ncbi:MAG: hypothetical protein KBG12_06330 [Syntrophobacterales bacterium]|nr:hypothetical protein [Syntrophobacterales bacterium]
MSDVVIKAENIRLVNSASRRTSPGFSRRPFVREEETPVVKEAAVSERPLEEVMEERLKAAEAEAYARGYSEGLKKGAEEERANLRSAVEVFSRSLEELSRLKAEVMKDCEADILSLAFAVAEKVVHQEVMTNRDVAVSVLKAAIKDVLERDGLRVRLSPADYRHLVEVNPEAVRSIEGLRNAQLEIDEAVEPGGVVIETLYGEVDARVGRQLSELRSALIGMEET